MTELLEKILETCGKDYDPGFIEAHRDQITKYIGTLVSTGKRDRRQLAAYGRAYLKELRSPDSRYTGC